MGKGVGPSLAKAEGSGARMGLRGFVCGLGVVVGGCVCEPVVGIWAEEWQSGVQGLLSGWYLAVHVFQLSPEAPLSALCVLLHLGHLGPQTGVLLLEGVGGLSEIINALLMVFFCLLELFSQLLDVVEFCEPGQYQLSELSVIQLQ